MATGLLRGQPATGRWGREFHEHCYATIFMAKARAQVVINKLEYTQNNWDVHTRDVANLVGDMVQRFERPLNWQIVDLKRDVRELQLATGAIRAGIVVLLGRAGLRPEDLEAVWIAGGFGNFIRRSNAQRIGLLPWQIERRRICYQGNTSLAGARLVALSQRARSAAEDLARRTEHVDLSRQPAFQNTFAEAKYTHRIITWEEVSASEGSGIVHIAPGCGKEDFDLSKEHKIPVLMPIAEDGVYYQGYGFLTGQKGVTHHRENDYSDNVFGLPDIV